MRFSTRGEIRKVDLEPLLELVPALRQEWADVEFGSDGRVVNPLTGQPVDTFALVDGRHRRAGARYRTTAPEDGGPATNEELIDITLRSDSARELAVTVEDEQRRVKVDVELEHGRMPKVSARLRMDITALLRSEGEPGCMGWVLGGTGTGDVVVDLGTLEAGGRTAAFEGRTNRIRAASVVDVESTRDVWKVTAAATLRAKGLARPVLWFGRRSIRRAVTAACDEFWAGSDELTSRMRSDLADLRAAIDEEGGPAPFVHRLLWDRDFDPELPSRKT
jgi:hypothetical protein